MIEKALEKLESQYKAEKDPVRKQFAQPILEHLKKRCREDAGLCEDILQDHKTWSNCYSYITQTARKHCKGNACAVIDSTVYEWAEDYYRKDDKAEAEKKKAEQKKKSPAKKSQKPPVMADKTKAKPNTSEPKKADSSDSEGSQEATEKAKQSKAKSKNKETEGQMNIFDFLGGGA